MELAELSEPRADVFVSVVVIIDDDIPLAAERIRSLGSAVAGRYRNYEIVIIDNQLSPDTLIQLRQLLPTEPCLRILRLSRRSAVDTAVFAGLDAAIGDYIVVTSMAYDSDEAVLGVVEKLRSGSDVVEGLSDSPLGGGPLTQLGRGAFYWYNRRFLDVDIPARSTYLTGLTRAAANSLGAAGRTHRYLHHLIRYIGFRVDTYEYSLLDLKARRVSSRPKGLDAIEMVSSYSTHPLRVVTVIGLVAALFNLLYAVYVIIVTFVVAHVAEGWPTTSLQLSVMFFIIGLILAVQAEYVGRILSESRREAGYFITEELESDTVIAETERRNVARA
ncbi:glycosyltransferase [uncultured Amnibacterium sp.]|uniref:glycosyltransferase n=1 Tax=uncultured Amnibacterium sp. TaxID=1631851 RepID=UPI0035CA9206